MTAIQRLYEIIDRIEDGIPATAEEIRAVVEQVQQETIDLNRKHNAIAASQYQQGYRTALLVERVL